MFFLLYKKDLAPFYTELNPLLKLTLAVVQKIESHFILLVNTIISLLFGYQLYRLLTYPK